MTDLSETGITLNEQDIQQYDYHIAVVLERMSMDQTTLNRLKRKRRELKRRVSTALAKLGGRDG